MTRTPEFRYRYGLSFPGQITKGAQAPVDFRAVVEQVAERMCASCENKPELILYDRYHQGVFARPDLINYLPAQYKLSELIVVFLCRDYANKHWCQAEWQIISELVKDPQQRHRVMLLWRGDHDPKLLSDHGLSWQRDGFLEIDTLSPQEIWLEIHSRYQEDQRRFRDERQIVPPPPEQQNPHNECQRLLIFVQRAHARTSSRLTADSQFDVRAWRDPAVSPSIHVHCNKKQLAEKILDWYSSHLNALAHSSAGDPDPSLLVALHLTAELIQGQWLPDLLRLLRQAYERSQQRHPGVQPVPMVVACLERLLARPGDHDQGEAEEVRRWVWANTWAVQISKQILHRCGASSTCLQQLNWLMFHDQPTADGQDSARLPAYFQSPPERRRCQAELQTLRVSNTANDGYSPHALYLRGARKVDQEHRRGMMRILLSGVPFFVIVPPEFDAAVAAAEDHPFDGLLRHSYADLMRGICQQHSISEPPADPDQAAFWRFTRSSIFFCEDHRFRPPDGAVPIHAQSASSSVALFNPLQEP